MSRPFCAASQPVGIVTRNEDVPSLIRYVPGSIGPEPGSRASVGCGLTDGATVGEGEGSGPPGPLPLRGSRLMPTKAMATTAAAATKTLAKVFMSRNLRAGHQLTR